jgi:transposase
MKEAARDGNSRGRIGQWELKRGPEEKTAPGIARETRETTMTPSGCSGRFPMDRQSAAGAKKGGVLRPRPKL